MSSAYPPHNQGYNDGHAANSRNGASREPDDIDELIRKAELGIKPEKKTETSGSPAPGAAPVSSAPPPTLPTPPKPVAATPEVTEKKSSKKEKDMPKMVYSDNEISPEEKMAKLSRYAFVPEKKDDTILVDANQAPGVAGTVDST